MSERLHWIEAADRVWPSSALLLGEDERGDLWAGRCGKPWRRFAWWRPRHAVAYVNNRVTRRLVWLETP